MAVTSQIQDAKERIRVFLSSYFDGYDHTVLGEVVEFPDCYVRMLYTYIPEGSNKSFDKPLITLILTSGASVRGKWVTDTDSGSSDVFVTWDRDSDAVGYYVERSLTEVGGYERISNLLTGLSYVDTPSAGDYWYQIIAVDDDDAETDWGSPVNHTASAIVTPKITEGSELVFHVFVAATQTQGGQRIIDTITSLLITLFNSSQSMYLREFGLKFPTITMPDSLQPRDDIWASSMFLTFQTTVEYG